MKCETDLRVESALRGECLFGDDFSSEEIRAWFSDEVNGYASLEHLDSQSDRYVYHALDAAYAWRHVGGSQLRVLGLGSAYGSEFRPIASKIASLTIVEPGEKFWRTEIAGLPAHYLPPHPSGILPLEAESFDLVTAFGVLHHIPNVSTVFAELVRVLKPGGLITVREPITSMGDWRRPRRGLTPRERGIPRDLMTALAVANGCKVVSSAFIGFAPLVSLATRRLGSCPWNSPAFVYVDHLLSKLSLFNYTYHRTHVLARFAPSVGCWVFAKNFECRSQQ